MSILKNSLLSWAIREITKWRQNYEATRLGCQAGMLKEQISASPYTIDDPRHNAWAKAWWKQVKLRRQREGVPDPEFLAIQRKDGIPNLTPPVRVIVDASLDGVYLTYVALIKTSEEKKPRLLYKAIRNNGRLSGSVEDWPTDAEAWAIKDVIRRINIRYEGRKPILIHTDNLGLVNSHGNTRVQYKWVSRENPLLQHMHDAANALRRSLPKTEQDWVKVHKFAQQIRNEATSRLAREIQRQKMMHH